MYEAMQLEVAFRATKGENIHLTTTDTTLKSSYHGYM